MQNLINELRKLIEFVGENRNYKKTRHKFTINQTN